MKSVHFSALLTALALTNMSCEKVIDLELDTAEASTVIEGKLEASATEFQLAISQTSAYFSPRLAGSRVWCGSQPPGQSRKRLAND